MQGVLFGVLSGTAAALAGALGKVPLLRCAHTLVRHGSYARMTGGL